MIRALACAGVLSTVAYAEGVDVDALPPLPADAAVSTSATVLAAAAADEDVVEVEGAYRNAQGWLAFAGAALARVGTEVAGSIAYGDVSNAPVISASAGASTPKLLGRVHLSTQVTVLGERPTRPDAMDQPSPRAPAWVGVDAIAYAPDLWGFDVTVGARNVVGERDLMPAPGDYDRSMPDTRVVPRVPGEGREVYVKVGYSY